MLTKLLEAVSSLAPVSRPEPFVKFLQAILTHDKLGFALNEGEQTLVRLRLARILKLLNNKIYHLSDGRPKDEIPFCLTFPPTPPALAGSIVPKGCGA